MKSRFIITLIIVFLSLASTGKSQYVREFNPWPVIIDSDTLLSPFWGGFNDPKPTLVDFNGDSLVDLMIGDPAGKLSYFKNVGSAMVPAWIPIVERLAGTDIGPWHTFVDIDTDGDDDLFIGEENGGLSFYLYPGSCCVDERGNVDDIVGPGGSIDVADLSYLVAYLFKGRSPPPCELEGNIDGIVGPGGPSDVSDVSYLVTFLFSGGPSPPDCP